MSNMVKYLDELYGVQNRIQELSSRIVDINSTLQVLYGEVARITAAAEEEKRIEVLNNMVGEDGTLSRLGFRLWQNNVDSIYYERDGDSYCFRDDDAPCYIAFNLKEKKVTKYRIWIDGEDRSQTREFQLSFQAQVDMAIEEKKKELGWE